MDVNFARAILQGPLRFGDESQLEAKQLLECLEPYRRRLAACPNCGGRGLILRGRPPKLRPCYCVKDAPHGVLAALGLAPAEGGAPAG